MDFEIICWNKEDYELIQYGIDTGFIVKWDNNCLPEEIGQLLGGN